MITPSFKVSQDNEFIFITIKAPYAKLNDLDIYVYENDFRFYCKPYWLRLNLPGHILESNEDVFYDFEDKVFNLKFEKKTSGEYFEGLDLITKLLTPAKKKSPVLIEELNTEESLASNSDNQTEGTENDDQTSTSELVESSNETDNDTENKEDEETPNSNTNNEKNETLNEVETEHVHHTEYNEQEIPNSIQNEIIETKKVVNSQDEYEINYQKDDDTENIVNKQTVNENKEDESILNKANENENIQPEIKNEIADQQDDDNEIIYYTGDSNEENIESIAEKQDDENEIIYYTGDSNEENIENNVEKQDDDNEIIYYTGDPNEENIEKNIEKQDDDNEIIYYTGDSNEENLVNNTEQLDEENEIIYYTGEENIENNTEKQDDDNEIIYYTGDYNEESNENNTEKRDDDNEIVYYTGDDDTENTVEADQIEKPEVKNVVAPAEEIKDRVIVESLNEEEEENISKENESADNYNNVVNEEVTNEDDIDEWYLEQKVNDFDENNIRLTTETCKYGFAQTKSNVFSRLSEEYLLAIDIQDPDNNQEDRAIQRMNDENQKFNDDHYLADHFDDTGIIESSLLQYTPVYSAEYTDQEIDVLKNLPKKSFLLEKEQKFYAFSGLIDILFAYCYNRRINCGEPNVESGWTIAKLSSTLSWFDTFKNLEDTIVASYRRCICFPLYRNWKLTNMVFKDLVDLLKKGTKQILKALLDIRKSFLDSCDNRYILNDLYINDYLVWIQYVKNKKLASFVECVEKINVTKQMVDFDLECLEICGKLALESENREDSDDNESEHLASNYSSDDDEEENENENDQIAQTLDFDFDLSTLKLVSNQNESKSNKPKIIELN